MIKTYNAFSHAPISARSWSLIRCLLGALLITGCSGQNQSSSSTTVPASSAPASSQPVASSSSQASSAAPVVDTFGLTVNAISIKQVQTNTPITVNTAPLNNASLELVRKTGGAQ
ncbi:hypothetical protein [Marinagarivorans algicola]|uniref:hypothetical protein n=1 Tax=Marinagarivorans algicola TaxID=1513270 RepID=UPI0006BA0B10|nr:hypothetical protein [Marinagarivorans algicola]